jgi:hypothetical protein
LGYPLDFKDISILSQACAPFAKVLYWNSEDPSLSRVLLKVLVEDPLEVPRSLVMKIGKELDGDGRSWTIPIYVFNSDMVNAGLANEEDPLANNGDPHPFHGPVVPGEPDFVAHIADQFINNLPQQVINLQVPDQGSQNNSVVAQDDSTIATLFTQGQHPSEEIEIEEDQVKPMEIESSGKEKENEVNSTQADKELEDHNGSCLKEQQATLMNIDPPPPMLMPRWMKSCQA